MIVKRSEMMDKLVAHDGIQEVLDRDEIWSWQNLSDKILALPKC
jgi:hypothetical protein